MAKSRLIGKHHHKQQHARKFHSYFLVFIKKPSKVIYSFINTPKVAVEKQKNKQFQKKIDDILKEIEHSFDFLPDETLSIYYTDWEKLKIKIKEKI